MKTDLDSLMQAHDLDAILVTGPAQHNPSMYYLTGGAHITAGDLVKPRGQEPLLVCGPMERDEAAKSGFQVKTELEYPHSELLAEAGGDTLQARALRYQRILTDAGVTRGRIGVYGVTEVGPMFDILTALQQRMPGLTLTGELNNSVLVEAMATKSPAELARIRRMGAVTTEVVGKVAEFLTGHKVSDEVLIRPDGTPLTIEDVKRRINLWLAEGGAENPEGTIFAIGRDAGVPHSSGTNTDPLRLGRTIVFDIFPCEAGGGYYYDFTRTWSLGYATDEAYAIYEDVLSVFRQVTSELEAGRHCKEYQARTCELFEEKGHPTIQSNPQTTSGYVHGLGHGVGLHVHEFPRFGREATPRDVLAPGVVFTIEPGLYYPERGLGVRLEDTLTLHPGGRFEVLAEYPLDFVLPMG